jgi:hypothetical protein
MKKFYYLALTLITLSACKSKNEEILEVDLTSKKIVVDQLIVPDKIRFNAGLLYLLESPSMESTLPPIHVLDGDKMEYLKSMGRIGFGPGEISDASSIDFDKDEIIVYSAIDKKISYFSLDSNQLASKQLKQKNGFYRAYSVLNYSDSSFLGLTVDSPSRFVLFNSRGDSIASFGILENYSKRKDLDHFNVAQLNMGWFSVSPSKSYYAVANIFTNRIDLLVKKTSEVQSIYLNPKAITNFDLIADQSGHSVHWDLSSPYFYRDVVVTDQYIFGLYGGISERKIQSNSDIAKTVFVFTIEGKLIAKLNLDVSINSLAVSDDLSRLYGITTDANPGIAEFKMPNF